MVKYNLTGIIEVEAKSETEASAKLHDSFAFSTNVLVERVNDFFHPCRKRCY